MSCHHVVFGCNQYTYPCGYNSYFLYFLIFSKIKDFVFLSRSLKLNDCGSSSMKTIMKLGNTVENLYMGGNKIKKLHKDLFRYLPCLKWLDLRDNYLIDLPISLSNHPTLQVVLLDNNLFTELPSLLCTLPRLQVVGLRENILNFPGGDLR